MKEKGAKIGEGRVGEWLRGVRYGERRAGEEEIEERLRGKLEEGYGRGKGRGTRDKSTCQG